MTFYNSHLLSKDLDPERQMGFVFMYIVKECGKCLEYKLIYEFVKHKSCLFERSSVCKSCNSNYKRKYREDNKDRISKTYKDKYIKDPEPYKNKSKNYYIRNKDKVAQYSKAYYERNKEKISERNKKYRANNKDKLSNLNKIYKSKNSLKIKESNKLYYNNNKERINEYRNAYGRNRRRKDAKYSMILRVRTRLYIAIKNSGFKKSGKTLQYIGCSFDELRLHLERQFTDGMNWDNFGEWHIDHIIPFCSAKTEDDIVRISHYSNLRPLWAKDNLAKGGKFINNQ